MTNGTNDAYEDITLENDNGTKVYIISDKETPPLSILQGLVGGYIEVAYETRAYQTIVNEEGLPRELDENYLAMGFAGPHSDQLVGDVIILVGDAKLT